MVKPGYLILDEIDRAKPDLGYVLTQFLESGKGGLRLLADGGRMVYPHPLFRIVATANTVGMGDESGHYQGARHQSLAILNRFNKWATVDYLDKEAEAKLLMAKAPGLSKQIADRLVNFAKEIRAGFRQGAFMYVVSPRNLITLARDFMFMSSLTDGNAAMEQVTRNTILNSLTLQDKVAVREIASRTLGVSRK
jgi:cobaltochelatase CobS